MINIIKLIRIKQWVKNLFILVPLFFSQSLFNKESLLKSFITLIGFCLITSSVYILNDIIDIEKDRLHPVKKNRPLASGKISIKLGVVLLILLFTIGMILMLILTNKILVICVLIYVILNILYSLILKNLQSFDLITLASFFVIRVFIGATAIGVDVSSWLIICTFTIALFLGTGKRYIELVKHGISSRKVLNNYSKEFLIYTLYLSSFSSIVFYALFCLTKGLYYEFSVIPVVGGFLMYFLKLFKNEINEDPSIVFLKEKSILIYLIIWAVLIFILTYVL